MSITIPWDSFVVTKYLCIWLKLTFLEIPHNNFCESLRVFFAGLDVQMMANR